MVAATSGSAPNAVSNVKSVGKTNKGQDAVTLFAVTNTGSLIEVLVRSGDAAADGAVRHHLTRPHNRGNLVPGHHPLPVLDQQAEQVEHLRFYRDGLFATT